MAPTPAPISVFIHTEPDFIGYLVQAAAAAATIFAAYIAVRGAYRIASRDAQIALRTQRQQHRAERARLRDDRFHTQRAIRRQTLALMHDASFPVATTGRQPAVGTLESHSLHDATMTRFAERAYDIDVAASFTDEELFAIQRAAAYLRLFQEIAKTAWSRPMPRGDDIKLGFAKAAFNSLLFMANAFDLADPKGHGKFIREKMIPKVMTTVDSLRPSTPGSDIDPLLSLNPERLMDD